MEEGRKKEARVVVEPTQKQHLYSKFEIKDLGELRYFLGMEFARSKIRVVICQRKCTLDLLEETRMLGAKPVDSPIEQDHGMSGDSGELLNDIRPHRRFV